MNVKKNKFIVSALAAVMLNGCTAIGKIENNTVSQLPVGDQRYTVPNHSKQHAPGETLFLLAFSGGGTRAAALSYGVMEELRDTHYQLEGKEVRLLDNVDRISSVSGGSFTSAYYGLYGNKIFDDFEEVFLKKDIQKSLISGLLNPFNWVKFTNSGFDRTELAIDHYDKTIFDKKTFADFRENMPFIQINATDLNSGQPFIFKQEYFDLLCSDLSSFKVARAVTASSAVPVAFAPVVLKNHNTCDKSKQLEHLSLSTNNDNFRLHQMKQSLNNYSKKEKKKNYFFESF